MILALISGQTVPVFLVKENAILPSPETLESAVQCQLKYLQTRAVERVLATLKQVLKDASSSFSESNAAQTGERQQVRGSAKTIPFISQK